MQRRGDVPRIKLDLTDDEIVVLEPVKREVHHPYSDKPEEGIHVLCYSFEEVFAEKMRALAERERPRDLYDVVHLYRRDGLKPDRALILKTLSKKCQFKNIAVPTMESLSSQPQRQDIELDWENMLAHQLPVLPAFQQFWDELSDVLDWLNEVKEKEILTTVPAYGSTIIDDTWRPPSMAQAWHIGVPLEIIRFAAANRLCIDLEYKNKHRTIEPYSLRRTRDGNILLHAVRHEDGQPRSYRIDRIQDAVATNISFVPRYAIDLTADGSLYTPVTERASTHSVNRNSALNNRRSTGPIYVVECSYCGKKFRRKINSTAIKEHNDKNGYSCSGRHGYLVDTIY